MVVSGGILSRPNDRQGNFELRLQGKNLTPKQFNDYTLNIIFDDGSTTAGIMYFESDEGDNIQYYNVQFDIDISKYNQLTSFRFSPVDEAFEVSCVDLNKT